MAVWYTARAMGWPTKAMTAAGLLAAAAIVIAALSGVQHLRKLVSQRGPRVVPLHRGEYPCNGSWLMRYSPQKGVLLAWSSSSSCC
jgi:hypothetical protein